jgi:hypothetical protein
MSVVASIHFFRNHRQRTPYFVVQILCGPNPLDTEDPSSYTPIVKKEALINNHAFLLLLLRLLIN